MRGLLLGLVLAGALAPAARAEVSVEASLDRDAVALGERVTLTVTVNGSGSASAPELPDLPDFSVFPAGTSRNFSFVNGKMSSATVYTYVLVPKREGTFDIPPVAVVEGKNRITSNPLGLVVGPAAAQPPAAPPGRSAPRGRRGGGDARAVFVTAEAAPLEAYVGEQVTVTVRFYQGVRLLERPDYRPPAATGFWVENLPGERTYYTEIEGRQYHVTELHSALFPTAAGELTIGPATVSCVIETDQFGRDPFSLFRSGFGAGDRRAIETKPIKIRARPVPREGRPNDWSGAVGRYRLEARLDPTRVKVGEAATLTVTLAGQGNVRAVGDPGLPDIAGLRSFDSGSAVQDTVLGGVVGGVKRFTRVLVPEASGSFTVPAIAYSVFRPDLHQFETIRTAPIALEVIEDGGAGLPGGTGSPGTHVLTAQGAGNLRFIRLGDPGLRPRRGPLWADRRFWLLQLLPMAGFGGVMLLARHRDRVRIDIGYARLRRSGGEARRRLKAARHHLERGDARTFYGAVAQALLGYVADRTNVPVAGLTPSEARARLEERELDPEVVAAFSALIERCDFGRFAPSPDGGQREVLNEAERVLRGLARAGL